MLETIYAIPINEEFSKHKENSSLGCPFCSLRDRMEANEQKIILGAAMMDPEIRKKTNEKGFCREHFDKLAKAQNRLGLALILESHLADVKNGIEKFSLGDLFVGKGNNALNRLEVLERECYLCEKLDYHMSRIYENTVVMWQQDRDFRELFDLVGFFCLKDYGHLIGAAKNILDKKQYEDFYTSVKKKELEYFEIINQNVSEFCRSFDYRNDGENSDGVKYASEEALDFLKGR